MSEEKPCRACGHPRKNDGRSTAVRSSWSAMKAQARLGCNTCGILSEGIEKVLHDEQSMADNHDDWQFRLDFNMHGSKSLDVLILGTDTVLTFFCSEVTPWFSKTLPDLPVALEVPPWTSSLESLTWVRQRVEECERLHQACSSHNQKSHLPKRVIDVHSTPIRLYESRGETSTPYICLSHVWGGRPFLQTTSANIASHKDAIDYHKLPPTFQDAISYTRQLGVSYLWIDSLCIIQDNDEDWRSEAAKMAYIYQSSYLVLSAAKSPNAYGGLFAEFPSSRCKTYTIELNPVTDLQVATTEKIHIRRSLTHLNNRLAIQSMNTQQNQQTVTLPTLSRGWIFQERFLAPRVLHFGPEELSWECFETSTCQCSSLPPPPPKRNPPRSTDWYYNEVIARAIRPKAYYSSLAWIADDMIVRGEDLTTRWHHLVEEYTRLSLTFEKDIFPALSGLASHMRFAVIMNGDSFDSWEDGLVDAEFTTNYLAGLWSHSLRRDILWRVVDYSGYNNGGDGEETPRTRKPSKWRAPSWSWASVIGPVEFLDQTETLESRCEILDVHYALAGPELFGELVDVEGSNFLVLKGRILPAVVDVNPSWSNGNIDAGAARKKWNAWEIIDLDIFRGHLKNVWVDDVPEWLDAGDSEEMRKVYCLLVGIKKTKALCFLLVRKLQAGQGIASVSLEGESRTMLKSLKGTDGAGIGETYQRVGVAEVSGGPRGPGSWTERLLALGENRVIKIF